MKSWDSKLRKLRPFKRFGDKIRSIKNNILESTCVPFAAEAIWMHVDEPTPRKAPMQTAMLASSEKKLLSKPSGLEKTMSRFNDGAGATSWVGVIPYRSAISCEGSEPGLEDVEVVPPQQEGQRQYHYRLRRIPLLEEQEEEEVDDAPFITPIPSVKIDIPDAPRKSEGTYSRYYAMFERGLASTSFDDYRPLLLGGSVGTTEKIKRHPKLEVIFGQGLQDSVDASGPKQGLFAGDFHDHTTVSTESKYKYTDETERDSTEIFMDAGIDHSLNRFLLSRDSSRNINHARFYHHDNETMLQLPSIDSDSASLGILSQRRSPDFDDKPMSSNSGSVTSQDMDDVQPISISISKLGSTFFSLNAIGSKYPPAPPNTPWTTKAAPISKETRETVQREELVVLAEKIREPIRMSRAGVPEEYSFISFAAPSRISLPMTEIIPALSRVVIQGPSSYRARSDFTTRGVSGVFANETIYSRLHLDTSTKGRTSRKKVRIVEGPIVQPTDIVGKDIKPESSHHSGPRPIDSSPPGFVDIEIAGETSFSREVNRALDALDGVMQTPEVSSGIPSNTAEKEGLKSKLDEVECSESALPPSALLSPVSKFSEGECTMIDYDEPQAPPSRRRRKFGFPGKKTNGVALTRTKTRDYRSNRSAPLMYRKLLDLYSMQYQNF